MLAKVVLILLLVVSFGYSKDNYWDSKGRLIVNEKSIGKMIQVPKRADIKTGQKKYSKSEIQKFHAPAEKYIDSLVFEGIPKSYDSIMLMSVDRVFLKHSDDSEADIYDGFLSFHGKVLETYKAEKKAQTITVSRQIYFKNLKSIHVPRYILVHDKQCNKNCYSDMDGNVFVHLSIDKYDDYGNKTYAYYPFESMEAVKEFKKAFKLKAQ
jgi:hypothetical protein